MDLWVSFSRRRLPAALLAVALIAATGLLPAGAGAVGSPNSADTGSTTGWIVQFKPGADHGQAVRERAGDAAVKRLSIGKSESYRVSFNGRTPASQGVAGLLQSPDVAFVEPDVLLHWDWTPNDPLFSQEQWAQTDHLPDAWSIATGQPSTVAAVVDTGVEANHPDLAGKVVAGYDFYDNTGDTNDDYGHGTGVAGVIAARANDAVGIAGTAPNVQIMPVRVGDGNGALISAVAQGMTYAVDHGASVINLSLGDTNQSATLQSALQYAYSHNVPVVAAAGNDPNSPSFPATYPQAISVAATTLDGSQVASFSSQISRVDLAAPGVNVVTSWWDPTSQQNEWVTVSGTSFSTPMVAGVVALMRGVNPSLTVEQIRGMLTGTARPVPNASGVGAGLLDANEALRHALLPNFLNVWQPADKPVATGAAQRTWEWGPNGWLVTTEPYAQSQQGQRLVAYFDKARMEITNPYGDPSSSWYVTNGLLANEMITGQMQTGDNSFVAVGPANVGVAGDADDVSGPTYATFNGLTGAQPASAGSTIVQTLNRAGQVGSDSRFAAYGVTAADYVPDTNHQVASVFWAYLNSSGVLYQNGQYVNGPLFNPTFYATGFPITEAYWAQVKVAGTVRDVLVQCFQRRCLTYTPSNPAGWRVEMGNVGRHYYTWRYGQQPPSSSPDDPTAAGS